MRKFIIALWAVVVILLVSVTGVVFANHFVYNAQNPDNQIPGAQYTENSNFMWWANGWSHVYWWGDPSAGDSFVVAARTAINNWKAAIPQLTWSECIVSEACADVKFRIGQCVSSGAAGCVMTWPEPSSYLPDHYRLASYWHKHTIYLDSDYYPLMVDSTKRGLLAHEIGHLYGLDERYNHSSPICNGNEKTIMDGAWQENPPYGYVWHCDGLQGPWSGTDVPRVT